MKENSPRHLAALPAWRAAHLPLPSAFHAVSPRCPVPRGTLHRAPTASVASALGPSRQVPGTRNTGCVAGRFGRDDIDWCRKTFTTRLPHTTILLTRPRAHPHTTPTPFAPPTHTPHPTTPPATPSPATSYLSPHAGGLTSTTRLCLPGQTTCLATYFCTRSHSHTYPWDCLPA